MTGLGLTVERMQNMDLRTETTRGNSLGVPLRLLVHH